MTENADTSLYAMSDRAIMVTLGLFLKETRLAQNKTQSEVAAAAGLVRSTLVQIESGKGGTLLSFIQIMRILGQLHLFQHFQVNKQISPLELAKLEQAQRQRASHKHNNNQETQSDW
jgi:transcriptional regulator with XRE-family HTH domain